MKNIARKPNRKNGGFTLAETLVAVLILLMVTAVVAAGIPVATNAYFKVVDSANAQVLLSTSITAIRNELEFAKNVEIPAGDANLTINYVSADTGVKSQIYNSDGGVMLKEYVGVEGVASPVRLIVSDKAATKNLTFRYDSVSYSGGIFTFGGLKVLKAGVTEPLAEVDTFMIRSAFDG